MLAFAESRARSWTGRRALVFLTDQLDGDMKIREFCSSCNRHGSSGLKHLGEMLYGGIFFDVAFISVIVADDQAFGDVVVRNRGILSFRKEPLSIYF